MVGYILKSPTQETDEKTRRAVQTLNRNRRLRQVDPIKHKRNYRITLNNKIIFPVVKAFLEKPNTLFYKGILYAKPELSRTRGDTCAQVRTCIISNSVSRLDAFENVTYIPAGRHHCSTTPTNLNLHLKIAILNLQGAWSQPGLPVIVGGPTGGPGYD